MSLADFFDFTCDELHHVRGVDHFFAPGDFRITSPFSVNRPSFRGLFPLEMHWAATTPPAVIDIDLYERRSTFASTDPVAHIHFVIIDCVPTINFLGTTHWWFGNSLQIAYAQGGGHLIRWAHIQQGADAAGSIGVYLFPFVE